MFILSDLYRVAISVGERVLTPGMKQVDYLPFIFIIYLFFSHRLGRQMVMIDM